ncbi:glycoside hydrolase family 30 protein [Enterococcus sp. HY326]|uniref:glycoside hydrolase family 30 protein n=1 Tax=Enterococcus sp. HY326 TaxID=2971265 RepID=UPI002240942E|nr:glycoside hydrolase family 30 beta sandwich domain-containing protein [Enterococcus sp. HY326]
MSAKIFTSSLNSQFEEKVQDFSLRSPDNSNVIKVFPNKPKQIINGFGSSFTEGAGVVFNSMTEKTQDELIDLYFSNQGSNYNMARMPIQSCDFSLGNYQYVDSLKDVQSGNFNFNRDDENIIPFIKKALERNPDIIFMSSPWSPPSFMKTNNDMNKGGYLKEEYYEAWADIIKAYLDHYLENGIKVQKFSVQNEPVAIKQWDSCLYTNYQEAYFAVKVLKKKLANTPHDGMEYYIWDHDKDGLIEWADQSFSNEEFRKNIDGVAFHWYTGDHFEQLDYLYRNYPEKDLLFSEGCVPQTEGTVENITNHGDVYIHDLINNFKNGMSSYIDWNILLDSKGGPNHMGNTCEAPIQYEKETDKLIFNLSYYYIRHFSHFIKKGACVVYSSSYNQNIEQVAFKNLDESIVLVLYNRSEKEETFRILEGNKELEMTLKAKEVSTVIW